MVSISSGLNCCLGVILCGMEPWTLGGVCSGKSVVFFFSNPTVPKQGMYREERRSLSSNGFELEMSPRCLAFSKVMGNLRRMEIRSEEFGSRFFA